MTLSLWTSLLSQELRRQFSYRVNFWLQFFTQTLGEVAVAYFLWKAIFLAQGASLIGGLSFSQMVAYYVYVALVGRVVRGKENFAISSEIYDGSLSKYLLYGVNYFAIKLTEHIGFMLISLVQMFFGLVFIGLLFSDFNEASLSLGPILLGLLASVSASCFYFFMMFVIELISFWADNVWSLSVMVRFIVAFLGGQMVPLSLMPEWLQPVLQASPFPSLASTPILLFLGQIGFAEFLRAQGILLLWCLPLAVTAMLVWRRGVLNFTGVGQ